MKTRMSPEMISAGMEQIQKVGWQAFHPFQLILNRTVRPPLPFETREDFLSHFLWTCDQKVIEQIIPLSSELSFQERLFEVFMTRFETLDPYKSTLYLIWQNLREMPGSLITCAPQWLVGFDELYEYAVPQGSDKCPKLKAKLFLFYYFKAQNTWFSDFTPDLAPTMAALDQGISNFIEIFY